MIKSHESIIGIGREHHTGLRHRDWNVFVTKFLRGLQKLPTIARSGDITFSAVKLISRKPHVT